MKITIEMDRKRTAIYLLAFCVLFALSSYISYSLLSTRFTLEVPDLMGRNLNEVGTITGDMALTVKVVADEFDEEMEAGRVLEQSVKPGTMVRGQAEVDLILSKGPEVRLIPAVVGIGITEAGEILAGQGLPVSRIVRVHTRGAPKGMVIAQSPEPNELTGQAMTLVVSQGKREPLYYNPHFLGMAKMDALMLARDLELSVRISELDNTNVITYQSPDPGTQIRRGDVLRLRVGG